MWSNLYSIDPGRSLMSCLFKFVASGAQTRTAGTNVTCTRNSTGLVTFTFTGVNIYNSEKPIILPALYLASAAGQSAHIGAVTITAATNTLTVQLRIYDSTGNLADLTTNDYFGLIVNYRSSNAS